MYLHYKVEPDSHHVAKFDGDRWMELGERVANKRNITGKTEARPELIVPGGLTNTVLLYVLLGTTENAGPGQGRKMTDQMEGLENARPVTDMGSKKPDLTLVANIFFVGLFRASDIAVIAYCQVCSSWK